MASRWVRPEASFLRLFDYTHARTSSLSLSDGGCVGAAQVYPLFAAMGVAVGICGFQLFRNITGNPEVRSGSVLLSPLGCLVLAREVLLLLEQGTLPVTKKKKKLTSPRNMFLGFLDFFVFLKKFRTKFREKKFNSIIKNVDYL
jgi:hypothetical protein